MYMLMVAGLVHLIMLEGFQRGTASEYSEQSLTEWLESGCALLSGLLFLVVAKMDRLLRPVTAMLAALCFMMFIREADFFLDEKVFDGSWQVFVSVVLVVTTVYLWRNRQFFAESLEAYVREASAGLFLSGFLVLLVFSRLFGRGSFWQVVMGDNYQRVVKNIAEEGTEIMGYGLMAIAATELLVRVISDARRLKPGSARIRRSAE